MANITGKQCKAARALLKWNLHDLASRTRVHFKRIDSFEKAMCHLHKGEHDEIVHIFTEAGIEFRPDFEVVFNADRLKQAEADLGSHSTVIIDGKGKAEVIIHGPAKPDAGLDGPEDKAAS